MSLPTKKLENRPAFVDIQIPSMGESVTSAVVGRFLVESGVFVKAGQEIVELETDKLNQTLNASCEGVVIWQVAVGDVVKIGQLIGQIEPRQSEAASSTPDHLARGLVEMSKIELNETNALKAPKKASKARVLKEETLSEIQPQEKEIEEEKALLSSSVQVNEAARSSRLYKEKRVRLPQMRKTIAERLLKAQQETAMLTTFNEIDMFEVMQIREKYGEKFLQKHGVKLGFMSFFAKAAVSALKKVPALNSRIEGEELVERLDYHLGVAVSTEKGLVVPVIRDCDQLSLAEIEKELGQVALRAREGKIVLEDLQGGSFTLTNGGVFGSLLSTPILNYPQSGILGMHKIQKRPVVNDKDEIIVRPMMYVALTYDHRVVDGRQAVSFLVAIKEAIEQPEKLWLDI